MFKLNNENLSKDQAAREIDLITIWILKFYIEGRNFLFNFFFQFFIELQNMKSEHIADIIITN